MADQSKPIGILFVHGIGAEKQGETLLGYSEPVFNWIARWLSAGNGTPATRNLPPQSIEVISTDLYPKNGAPAHSRWVMHLRDGENNLQKTDWIAAESWWAETIVASNWRQTIDWAMEVVPSIVFFQLSNFVRRVFHRKEREFLAPILAFFFAIPYAAFGFLLLILLNTAAFLLGILALFQTILPIAILRTFIQSIQVIVSQWAGDIFLVLNSPIQRSAMVSKVKKDLAWLKKNCSQVVIVAHSQGAAISYQVLQEDRSSQITGFVTLGSAIKLLKKVESVQASGLHKRFVRWFYGFSLFVIPSLLIFVNNLRTFLIPGAAGTSAPVFDWMNLLISATPFVIVINLLILVVQWLDPDPDRIWDPIAGERPITRKGFRWCDLYASNDPAPDGRFSRNPPDFLQSSQVYNRANLLLDHTTYWENLDEFVTAVAVFLSDVTNTRFVNLTAKEAASIQIAKARRRRRFGWLIWSRTLALASALALLGSLRHALPGYGMSLLGAVNWLLGLVSNKLSISLNQPEALRSLLGAIAVLSIPLIWHLFTGRILRWWQELDLAKLFRREVDNSGLLPLRSVASMMGILLFGTAGYILAPYLTTASTPGYLLAFAAVVILLSISLARLLPIGITLRSDMRSDMTSDMNVWSPRILGIKPIEKGLEQPTEEPPPQAASPGWLRAAWAWAPVVLTVFPYLLILRATDPMKVWLSFALTLAVTLLAWWNLLAFLQAPRSSPRWQVHLIAIGLNTLAYVIWLLIWLRS